MHLLPAELDPEVLGVLRTLAVLLAGLRADGMKRNGTTRTNVRKYARCVL